MYSASKSCKVKIDSDCERKEFLRKGQGSFSDLLEAEQLPLKEGVDRWTGTSFEDIHVHVDLGFFQLTVHINCPHQVLYWPVSIVTCSLLQTYLQVHAKISNEPYNKWQKKGGRAYIIHVGLHHTCRPMFQQAYCKCTWFNFYLKRKEKKCRQNYNCWEINYVFEFNIFKISETERTWECENLYEGRLKAPVTL